MGSRMAGASTFTPRRGRNPQEKGAPRPVRSRYQLAALRQGKWRLQRPALADIVKPLVGGALMGVGVALIPGGNNELILAAIPALSPGGTAAYLLMTATIVIGLSRSEEHTSELQSLMRHSYAVFWLNKKKLNTKN